MVLDTVRALHLRQHIIFPRASLPYILHIIPSTLYLSSITLHGAPHKLPSAMNSQENAPIWKGMEKGPLSLLSAEKR